MNIVDGSAQRKKHDTQHESMACQDGINGGGLIKPSDLQSTTQHVTAQQALRHSTAQQ
jgi:hypothetical protein